MNKVVILIAVVALLAGYGLGHWSGSRAAQPMYPYEWMSVKDGPYQSQLYRLDRRSGEIVDSSGVIATPAGTGHPFVPPPTTAPSRVEQSAWQPPELTR